MLIKPSRKLFIHNAIAALLVSLLINPVSAAHHSSAEKSIQQFESKRFASMLQFRGNITPPPKGVVDIKFREFFKMPMGPHGLEPTEKLLSLNGKQVRIIGYMVNAEEPAAGPFILAPLAVSMAEKEDGPADDMPATTLFVHIENGENWVVPHVPGLLKLTGTLELGNREESDGRVSSIRLKLDPELSRKLLGGNQAQAVQAKKSSKPINHSSNTSNI
jgi:hypothetical protein